MDAGGSTPPATNSSSGMVKEGGPAPLSSLPPGPKRDTGTRTTGTACRGKVSGLARCRPAAPGVRTEAAGLRPGAWLIPAEDRRKARPRWGLAPRTCRGRSRPRLPGQRRGRPRRPGPNSRGLRASGARLAARPRPTTRARARQSLAVAAGPELSRPPGSSPPVPPRPGPDAGLPRSQTTYSGCSRSVGASAAAILNFLTPRRRWRRLPGRWEPVEAEEEGAGSSRMCRPRREPWS